MTHNVVAVVVASRGEHDTGACMESLERQDYPSLAVLLVDAGAPGGSGARLHARYPAIPFLALPDGSSLTAARNAGMKWALDAGARYALLVDGGAVLDPTCVRELVHVAGAHADAGAVGGKILRYDDPARIWFAGGTFDRLRAIGRHEREYFVDLDPEERQVLEATFLTSCCLLIPAATIRGVGYFREDLFAQVEEAEYALRVARSGQRLLYTPAARLRHRAPPRGEAPPAPEIRLRDQSRRRLVRQYYTPAQAALFAAWFVPTRIALAARYLLQGEIARARAVMAGMREP